MKPRSAKSKGKGLQNKVRDKLLEAFPELERDDIGSQIMGCGGEDVTLSPAARKLLPISIECKKNKAFAVYKHYDQCVANANDYQPVVIIEADRRKPLVLVDLDFFIRMLVENQP